MVWNVQTEIQTWYCASMLAMLAVFSMTANYQRSHA